MNKLKIITLLSLLLISNTFSHQPRRTTIATFSKNMKYVAIYNPNKECCTGEIVIYKFNETGIADSIWSAKCGILGNVHKVLLSNYGDNLFIYNWYYNKISRKFDPALQYINSTGLNIIYTKRDFPIDSRRKDYRESGHHWLAGSTSMNQFYYNDDKSFRIILFNKKVYEINPSNGDIIGSTIDTFAQTKRDLFKRFKRDRSIHISDDHICYCTNDICFYNDSRSKPIRPLHHFVKLKGSGNKPEIIIPEVYFMSEDILGFEKIYGVPVSIKIITKEMLNTTVDTYINIYLDKKIIISNDSNTTGYLYEYYKQDS